MDDVILLASHGVDADYLKALRKAGFGDLDTEDIIRRGMQRLTAPHNAS